MDERLSTYMSLLKEYNQHTNIYSAKAYDHLDFHIKDSVTLAHHIKNDKKNVFDFGSGSGLPSIPIAINNPRNTIYAVESKSRKSNFLDHVKKQLSLNNLIVIHSNIYEWTTAVKPAVITAKAFASHEKILKMCKQCKLKNIPIITPISLKQKKELSIIKNITCFSINTFHYATFTSAS